MPMTWQGRLFQWNRLCKPDKGLDAKQVGIHHRFFRQELVEGLHSLCSRLDALSAAYVRFWRLLGVVSGFQGRH